MLKFLAWPSVAPISQNTMQARKKVAMSSIRRIAALQKLDNVAHAGAAIGLVFARRRH